VKRRCDAGSGGAGRARGRAVGIDTDRAKLELAQEAARERGLANVAFEAADVSQWTAPGGYDFVYCRFLLQHLATRVGLLRRMWDAVRPVGVLAVEDADLEGLFCDLDNDGFSLPADVCRGSGP